MMLYESLLNDLRENEDIEYREFHRRLLNNPRIDVIGVRVPVLRKIAKKYQGDVTELLSLPDEYYEVTFVKLCAASCLPYERFTEVVDECVARIDNWATCDCFSPKCIKKHREEFLPYVAKYLSDGREFYQRFALTTLLSFYVEEPYLGYIFDCLNTCDASLYYVHMAAAWLTAEILVKYFDRGTEFLKKSTLDKKTHNKAIQKATESFRLSEEQKIFLKGLKR